MPTVKYEMLPHQWQAWQSRKRHVVMFGGVGCGKTSFGSLWALNRARYIPPNEAGLICANTYTQLYDSTLTNVLRWWSAFGVRHRPETLPESHGPITLRVYVGGEWRNYKCRSLDAYATLAGIETGVIWADELWGTCREARNILIGRLRADRWGVAQMLGTTTTDDPSSWLYEDYVERLDAAHTEVIYAHTTDNPHLSPGYIESLRSVYDEREYARMCEAAWITLSKGQVYRAFSGANVSEDADWPRDSQGATLLPRILWSHDFNVGQGKPMSSVLAYMHGDTLRVADEIIMDDADTPDVVDEFVQRYPGHTDVVIYGDASGRARDTRSKVTDYVLLANMGFPAQDVPRKNPSIRDRHNNVNARLRSKSGAVRIIIHPRCKTLIKGLQTVQTKAGANYVEVETREQHVTTALGYLVCRVMPTTRDASAYAPTPKYWK